MRKLNNLEKDLVSVMGRLLLCLIQSRREMQFIRDFMSMNAVNLYITPLSCSVIIL